MKKKIFSWLSIFLVAALCVGFASCGGSDDDGGGAPVVNETVKKLMAKRWLYASADYNEYSYGAAAEATTDCLYFLDGQHGVNIWGSKEVDTNFGTSNNSGKYFFNYSVQGNRIVISYLNGNTQTLTFNESYLESGGNQYSGIDLTSDDQSRMATWRTQLVEELDAVGYDAAVKSGVVANIKKTDNFHQQLDITSNLAQKYPGKNITYIVIINTNTGNKYSDQYDEYVFKDNNDLHLDNLLALNADGSIYLKIYDSIMAKKNSGQSLTSEEREMLSSCIQILNDIANHTTFEFYVEINGKRFNIPTKYV